MKFIPVTISSPEDLRLATEVLSSLSREKKQQNDFKLLGGVLWLSPIEELLSPRVFQIMIKRNLSLCTILPQQSLYDCADSEARALQALACGSKRIIYNGIAFPLLKKIAAGYRASLQKNRPNSFLFDARARNSGRLLYSHIKNNLRLKTQTKLK